MAEIVGLLCSSAVIILAIGALLWDEYGDALVEVITAMGDDDGEWL